jgi:hypothetical protein
MDGDIPYWSNISDTSAVFLLLACIIMLGARGSVVGWGTMLQAGRSPVDCFNLPNTSSRTMTLGSTRPLTEMSTRNISGGLKILPSFFSRMSEIVKASTPRNPKGLHGLYRDNFTLLLCWMKEVIN